MKRARLADGLDVTAIGLGTAPLGGLFSPVSEADAGRCYEPGSGRSLAEGIAALLALPPDERVLMGLRGQELVRRRYTIAVTGAQLESALLELVGTSG